MTYILTLLLNHCAVDDNETVRFGNVSDAQGNEMCSLLRAIYHDILLASL